jgi:hypothetical protein
MKIFGIGKPDVKEPKLLTEEECFNNLTLSLSSDTVRKRIPSEVLDAWRYCTDRLGQKNGNGQTNLEDARKGVKMTFNGNQDLYMNKDNGHIVFVDKSSRDNRLSVEIGFVNDRFMPTEEVTRYGVKVSFNDKFQAGIWVAGYTTDHSRIEGSISDGNKEEAFTVKIA